MFNKILIANRGEIALRVIRACRELGIKTVAVYSESDKNSLHVRFADEAICIGGASPAESYLNIPRIISAAEISNVDAIHPGYGFLAENARFAEICNACNIKFIGPTAEAISLMGDKARAKSTMSGAGVPVIPGSEGGLKNWKEARKLAESITYPIILKASAGGGGRGMRVIRKGDDIKKNFSMAQQEAGSAFGNDELYLEKFIEEPHHVEVQVFGDEHGNAVFMGERDCSIQRRHQKLIEESPSPFISDELRGRMGEAAIKGVQAVNYCNAGTMEFLVDKDRNFYFMEMNTRIQVEHTVTEMVLGMDLVKEQMRVAAGEPLGYTQKDINLNGHAIECRINAEDSQNGFLPCPGIIKSVHLPGGPGVRIDTHVYADYLIPPHYDSLIAKVIAYGNDRPEALSRMERVLGEMIIEGVKTTILFHQKVLLNENFKKGLFTTNFITEEFGNGDTE